MADCSGTSRFGDKSVKVKLFHSSDMVDELVQVAIKFENPRPLKKETHMRDLERSLVVIIIKPPSRVTDMLNFRKQRLEGMI